MDPEQVSTSARTFGAKLCWSKLRSNSNIKIIWRMRQDHQLRYIQNFESTFKKCFIVWKIFLNPLTSLTFNKLIQITAPQIPPGRLQPGLELVPIRPVALLAGSLECKAEEMYQLA